MSVRAKSSQWAEFSQRLMRMYGLPFGSELRLYRKNDGRRVRSDFVVKRKAINRTNVAPLSDADNVAELIANARALLSTDIQARGMEVRLYGCEGDRVNGNTHLGKLRNAKTANQEIEPMEAFISLIESAGLDEISISQAGTLYKRLREHLGKSFDDGLTASFAS